MRRRSFKKKQAREKESKKHAPRKYVGRVQKNPRGFAFILPEDPQLPDAYVSRDQALALLNDDVVEFTLFRKGARASAEISRILERGQKEVVGIVRHAGREIVIETADGEAHVLERTREPAPVGAWVIARFEEYPTRKGRGLVSLDQVLGEKLLPEHDISIAVSRFGLPDTFSEKTGTEGFEGRIWARQEIDSPAPGRRDLRHLPLVTIDGEDAKDFDDAIYVDCPSQESPFVLYVAIADVSFFVRPGTALDEEARKRGTSVYFPGVCIPMLPEALSNDLCSLRPQTDKLALTAEMHFDRDGNIKNSLFYESIIRTARRLTYTEVHGYFEKDPIIQKELESLDKPLQHAHALFLKLAKKRKERGVLDFQLPESRIEVDSRGRPLGVRRAPNYEAHRLIEEFMISANQAVAKALRHSGTHALYRVHEAPEPTALEELNLMLRRLGISKGINEVSPRAFSKLLATTIGLKGAATLHQAVLRLQKQARYQPEAKGHFGLALADYTHFTSPIRRYPDLVVHRALKRHLNPLRAKGGKAEKIKSKEKLDLETFEALGQETSDRERRAMQAERWVVKRKQCWFMEQHLGKKFSGIICGVVSSGVFVEIPEFAIEGFLPIESLDGNYEFDEFRLCLRRQPGHSTLSIGDKLEIQVAQVTVEANEITFSLA